MRDRLGCGWRRNAVALVWIPVLLLGPVLDLHGSPGEVAFQVTIILVIAVATATAGLTGGPPWRSATPYVALSTSLAATVAGAMHASSQWLPTWILLANALPAVLRGRVLVAAVPSVALLSMGAAAVVEPFEWARLWAEGFVVLLAGLASSAFIALIDTVGELRRTRAELARVAVAEERERFSRDLHDLLGHTLSVMVVKAQAVRRLAGHDDEAVVAHATDIEKIGRQALVDVRRAVDAMRVPTLTDELDNARRALAAAGIATTVSGDGPDVGGPDEVLAWVVREAATNVLRHSGASTCRIEVVERDGRVALAVTDDGVGAPASPTVRFGGLDGLRDRVAAAGGELRVDATDGGFRLVATVPGGAR
ncbi:sensor histidine kinase [Nocardioides sp.]|uniref:sensor histidine kinase n=1 Tax=Nocardioides sp. TaxID=35761 RepID=UPI00378370D1